MQTATADAAKHPLPRPSYPNSSRTIVQQDARTRELAEAMVRLNAEGECTRTALRREGFSEYELEHLADAARAIANGLFVKRLEEAPRISDEQLLDIAHDRCAGLIDEGAIVAALRGAQFTHDTIARLWPKICARLARRVACMGAPAADGGVAARATAG